jgi:hypothetical protein
LWNIGLIFGGLGDYETGVTLVSAGRRLNEEQGLGLEADRPHLERFEIRARQALTADTYDAAARAGEALSIEEAIELALSYQSADIAAAAAGHTAPH